jgi:hypothetical protein
MKGQLARVEAGEQSCSADLPKAITDLQQRLDELTAEIGRLKEKAAGAAVSPHRRPPKDTKQFAPSMKNGNDWDVPHGMIVTEKFPIKINISILNSHCHFGRLDVHGEIGESAEAPDVKAHLLRFVDFH